MGHEKVARLLFCTVLVIFSLALVCILRRVFELLINSRAVTIPPPNAGRPRSHVVACINFCIYAMLQTWATFSWPILYMFRTSYIHHQEDLIVQMQLYMLCFSCIYA